jgi:uncharacterized circularly permuted ATP-grasp superfamily protein
MPKLPPRTTPKPGLARLQSLRQTLGVHVRDHQDFVTVVILYDGSNQSAVIKLQILNQQLGHSQVSGFRFQVSGFSKRMTQRIPT